MHFRATAETDVPESTSSGLFHQKLLLELRTHFVSPPQGSSIQSGNLPELQERASRSEIPYKIQRYQKHENAFRYNVSLLGIVRFERALENRAQRTKKGLVSKWEETN